MIDIFKKAYFITLAVFILVFMIAAGSARPGVIIVGFIVGTLFYSIAYSVKAGIETGKRKKEKYILDNPIDITTVYYLLKDNLKYRKVKDIQLMSDESVVVVTDRCTYKVKANGTEIRIIEDLRTGKRLWYYLLFRGAPAIILALEGREMVPLIWQSISVGSHRIETV